MNEDIKLQRLEVNRWWADAIKLNFQVEKSPPSCQSFKLSRTTCLHLLAKSILTDLFYSLRYYCTFCKDIFKLTVKNWSIYTFIYLIGAYILIQCWLLNSLFFSYLSCWQPEKTPIIGPFLNANITHIIINNSWLVYILMCNSLYIVNR